jgi:hypothetical protein
MWIVQYSNIVVLLYLINAKYNKLFETSGNADILPILNGKYSDFTGPWYGEVGTAIALTVAISCVTPIAQYYFFAISCFKRCRDQSCSCTRTKTRQLLQSKYEQIYMGSEFKIENQLAIFISMVMCIVTLTSSMPIFNLFAVLCCFIMYWTDKTLVLKSYKNPPPYTKEMILQVISIIEWGVPIHCSFGLFMLTNPKTFAYTPSVDYGSLAIATDLG